MDSYPTWFTADALCTTERAMAYIRKEIVKGVVRTVTQEMDDGSYRFMISGIYLVPIMTELAIRFPGACFVDVAPPSGLYKHWEVYIKKQDKDKIYHEDECYHCIVRVNSKKKGQ